MSPRKHVWNDVRVLLLGVVCLALTSCSSLGPGVPEGFSDSLSQNEAVPGMNGASSPAPAGASDSRAEPPAATEGPLTLTVESAILLAVESNRAFRVERLNPPIRRTFEEQERAVFDPVAGATASTRKADAERLARAGTETESFASKNTSGKLSLDTLFPTGTAVALEATGDFTDSTLYSDSFASTRVGLTVTQALLRGFGTRANLASLRQAELDTLSSEYELRAFAESLVSQVEATYWDYALTERQIEIYTQSLKLAEDQLTETVERIETGALAETELAAAQAEMALRREDLINARSSFATVRLRLLRLLNPPGTENWERDIVLQNQPIVLDTPLDEVVSHVRVALRMRPELNQALLGVKRGDLEIVKTRNGLLPKMDLFITLGKSGYANSFGRSFRELDEDNYDFLVGFTFEYPFANRDAEARHQRAILSRKQSVEAVGNLAQLVELDVRSAYIEVNRATEQVAATLATRKLQEEKLRAETEKFRVGKSTSLLVAQAQRDLVASQISEIQAVVNHLKALVELYRLEGSLLERRGISAPGREPFNLSLGQ
ncbi:MAG: TolC family protein [bacterium]|nr:TolC family protein [bacterium]